MAGGEQYRKEIAEQPAVLQTVLRKEKAGIEAIAEEILRVRPSYGLLAARGSSDNAARYAQYVLGVFNRLTCALATPSVSTVYESPPDMKGSLTIGLSQSGQSPDIVRVVQLAAQQGAMTLAITNDPTSPLAQVAGNVIGLCAGSESAVPATKTYTAELMVIAMLSAALRRSEEGWAVLEQVAQAVQTTLDLNAFIAGVEGFVGMKHLVVIGRGFNYATCFEVALKINEISSVLALPFSLADFFHGPVATLGPETPMLLIAPRGKLDAQLPKLLSAAATHQARLIVISDDEALLRRADVALRLPAMPEWISPLCAVVAGQLFSAALADVKVQDPDEPRGLSKITLTY